MIRGRITVDVQPVNAPEEGVRLWGQGSERVVLEIRESYFDKICTIHSAARGHETAPARLHDHRVRPRDRRGGLGTQAILRFTKELLHQVDSVVRDLRTGRESQGLLPIQNLLTRYMSLNSKGVSNGSN
jgi:hypothetical protein